MIIQQYKITNLAQAPDELCKCINKYTKHTSFVSSGCFKQADVIHFHNKYDNKKANSKQKILIQYHSEPEKVNLNFIYGPRLVIAQYHATLPEYQDCFVVRNIIDYNQSVYTITPIHDKIRIAYSPSSKKAYTKWANKGYEETTSILERLRIKYDVEVDIITGVSLKECIKRKAMANIVIDECMTGSYHRSGLEGLALGKMTICSLSKNVEEVLKKASHSDIIPFENVSIDRLEDFLKLTIENTSIKEINDIGLRNRDWIETYWNVKDILNEYFYVYEL